MKKYLLVLFILSLSLSACASGSDTPLVGATWELTAYGPAASPTPAVDGTDASITFNPDGTVTGNGGCNGFGGDYEVIHHTQLLGQLVSEGRLKVEGTPMAGDALTYHDPCYLARVNGIHEAPRSVLHALSGTDPSGLREMPRNREKTFCCGAGGGRMWMEEDPKKRVCSVRAKEALDTGAKTVAVGCPFCLTMMTDGVAARTDSARVLDVAEILAERLSLQP